MGKITEGLPGVPGSRFFTDMAGSNTLGKKERLKSRKRTGQVFSEGKKFSVEPFRVCYLFTGPGETDLQLGVGVSSRAFKKAVDRNRVKRLMREAWRLQKKELAAQVKERTGGLAVFIIYQGKTLPVYAAVAEKMKTIIHQLTRLASGT